MLCCHNAVRDRAVHALMCAKPAFCYLASSPQSLADSLADTLVVVMQGEAGPGGSRQEPGLQHEATTAAVQAHTAAAEMQARGPAGEMVGPLGAEGRQGPSDEDPVSPTGSSGSALDPQLYRWALAWVIFCAKMLAVTLTSNSTMVYNAVPILLTQSWCSADIGCHVGQYSLTCIMQVQCMGLYLCHYPAQSSTLHVCAVVSWCALTAGMKAVWHHQCGTISNGFFYSMIHLQELE